MSAAAAVVAASILVGGLERHYLLARPAKESPAPRLIWGAAPGKPQVELVVGKQNRDVETAEEAWTFFKDKRAAA